MEAPNVRKKIPISKISIQKNAQNSLLHQKKSFHFSNNCKDFKELFQNVFHEIVSAKEKFLVETLDGWRWNWKVRLIGSVVLGFLIAVKLGLIAGNSVSFDQKSNAIHERRSAREKINKHLAIVQFVCNREQWTMSTRSD